MDWLPVPRSLLWHLLVPRPARWKLALTQGHPFISTGEEVKLVHHGLPTLRREMLMKNLTTSLSARVKTQILQQMFPLAFGGHSVLSLVQ